MGLICPNCSSGMNIANKFGVEIDHCPRCKGVWLDRGELEKITNIQDRYEEDHYKKYRYERDQMMMMMITTRKENIKEKEGF